MNIMLIHPGHQFATRDVAVGLEHGFKRCGIDVHKHDLKGRAAWYTTLLGQEERIPPADRIGAAFGLAGDEIPAHALRVEPDAIIVINGKMMHYKTWLALAKLADIFPIHLVLTESPYEDRDDGNMIRAASVVWTNDRGSARRNGWKYLGPAWDEDLFCGPPPEAEGAQIADGKVLFIGTGWPERVELFSKVDWADGELCLIGPGVCWQSAIGTTIERFLSDAAVAGEALRSWYVRAHCVLNLHRRSVGIDGINCDDDGESLNPRAIQVPACKALLVSDERPEWKDVFGKTSLRTFSTAQELGEVVRFYRHSPSARLDAISESHEAVLGHTFAARAAQILETILWAK